MKRITTWYKSFTSREKSKHQILFLLLVCTVALSSFSFLYYYTNNLTLSYGDAKGHLNIARRVILSLTPGFAQLGGIWLPLPHVLDLFTVWNDFMYYSGLSGSIISMASFVIAVIITFKAIYHYTKNMLASFLGASVMLFNPSFLFLQTTPMTEPLSIATYLVAIYLIIKWAQTERLELLILAALATAISTLSRYDSWLLAPAGTVTVILVLLLKQKSRKKTESHFLLFIMLAFSGICGWLFYNFIIFGNLLYFSLGIGSGSYYATVANAITKHNLLLSTLTYTWAMIDNIGTITLILLILGVVMFSVKKKFHPSSIPAYLLLVPIGFNILSLFLGQSVLTVAQVSPYHYYNVRYGLNALPAAAFFVGILAAQSVKVNKLLLIPLVCFILVQYYFLFTSTSAVISEPGTPNSETTNDISWLKSHPTKGLTLVTTQLNDPLVFSAHISFQKIVYEGSGLWWKASLVHPERYVTRIILQNTIQDPIWQALHKKATLKLFFHLAYRDNGLLVYERDK